MTPEAQLDATLALAGYARTFTLFERSAMGAVLLPMGRISGQVVAAGTTFTLSAAGFGDPMVEFDINVVGPRAQKNLPDVLRYQPGFSVDLLADLAVPIGEYDSSQSLNIGQNRWYGRVGLPIVWQLGSRRETVHPGRTLDDRVPTAKVARHPMRVCHVKSIGVQARTAIIAASPAPNPKNASRCRVRGKDSPRKKTPRRPP